MARCLLFELFAPLVAWGDIAVGERRPARAHPSKSGVLGIVAAALGYLRDDDASHGALFARIEFGARIDSVGSLLTDYHTAQTAKASVLKQARKTRPIMTRADMLRHAKPLHTILSTRDYFVESLAIVALLDRGEGEPSVETIAAALDRPHFAPYLGRRCASPALPFSPRIVEGEFLPSILRAAVPSDAYGEVLRHLRSGGPGARRTLLWEGLAGNESATKIVRRDSLLSRSRWQFTERSMYRVDEEVGHVSLPHRT